MTGLASDVAGEQARVVCGQSERVVFGPPGGWQGGSAGGPPAAFVAAPDVPARERSTQAGDGLIVKREDGTAAVSWAHGAHVRFCGRSATPQYRARDPSLSASNWTS